MLTNCDQHLSQQDIPNNSHADILELQELSGTMTSIAKQLFNNSNIAVKLNIMKNDADDKNANQERCNEIFSMKVKNIFVLLFTQQ